MVIFSKDIVFILLSWAHVDNTPSTLTGKVRKTAKALVRKWSEMLLADPPQRTAIERIPELDQKVGVLVL